MIIVTGIVSSLPPANFSTKIFPSAILPGSAIADPISIAEIMTEQFGAKEQNGLFYFDDAKTLVMYCNGMWCGQSPNNIKSLLKYGYPADKIKFIRRISILKQAFNIVR